MNSILDVFLGLRRNIKKIITEYILSHWLKGLRGRSRRTHNFRDKQKAIGKIRGNKN